ncbi:MAG: response regulator, partial [Verrucomicrobiota bacterium]
MDSPSSSQLRVLVVEDDQVTARDLEETLKRRGFIVVGVAHDEHEARRLAEAEDPRIALVDVRLDNLDVGISLAKDLRAVHGVVVIFVTGYS